MPDVQPIMARHMVINNHFKFIRVALLLIVLSYLYNTLYSFPQINFQESKETIDSLLLEGNIRSVQIKYENRAFDFYDNEDLQVLFRSAGIVANMETSTIDKYIDHYKTLSDQYKIDYVGPNANNAYGKFLKRALLNEKADALKFYYISLFFKRQNLKANLISARNIFSEAYRYYLEERYDIALETLTQIKINSGNNNKLIALEDSIKLLQKDIINKQIEHERWNQTDARTNKLFFGFIPAVIYYGATSDISVKIENVVSSFIVDLEPPTLNEIHISEIPSAIDFELAFGVNYILSKKMMIGLDFGYTKSSVSSDYNDSVYENNTFFEFKFTSYMLRPYIKYLFSETIGLSPFFNIGMGYQTIQYYDAIGGKYEWFTFPNLKTRKIEYGDFALKSEKRIGIICDIGAEYIPGPSSYILYGSKIGGYYFLNQSSILNNYNITFSIYAGLIL